MQNGTQFLLRCTKNERMKKNIYIFPQSSENDAYVLSGAMTLTFVLPKGNTHRTPPCVCFDS